jgi:short-subunit dehydrogenase
VTYCASKHAVVGLSEAIRQEVNGTAIGVSIVMPIPVNTELGAGLNRLRGFRAIEPDAVAREIVAALQFGRVDVYVPRRIGWLLRSQSMLPRPVVDLIARFLGAHKVLASPDRAARAAYEARISSLPGDGEEPRSEAAGAA